MNAAIETELGTAIGAVVAAACPTATVRVFGVDDAAGAVDEDIAYPFVGVFPSPAVPVEVGDVLFHCRVRVLVGTHYTQDRKGTTLAALWKPARAALQDETSIDEAMAGNVRLLGLSPVEDREPFTTIQAGDVPQLPNLQGYELSFDAALAACDETTTTTTATTAP